MRRIVCRLLAGLLLLWCGGFVFFLLGLPAQPTDDDIRTDGIVVFTGPENYRISRGFDLFSHGVAPNLLISGVRPGMTQRQVLNWAHRPDMAPMAHVALGYMAKDTIGNASETAAWACAHHVRSLRLITADYHMPRALWLLHQALPDAHVVPDAAIWPHGARRTKLYWISRGLYQRVAEYQKNIIQRVVRAAGLIPELDGACTRQAPPQDQSQ